MPAAAVIPAPIAYIKVAAVKKLVDGSREWAGGPPRGEPPPVPDPASRRPPDAVNWVSGQTGARSVYFEKIRVFKAGRPSPLNTAARNNGIGLRFYFVGFWNPGP